MKKYIILLSMLLVGCSSSTSSSNETSSTNSNTISTTSTTISTNSTNSKTLYSSTYDVYRDYEIGKENSGIGKDTIPLLLKGKDETFYTYFKMKNLVGGDKVTMYYEELYILTTYPFSLDPKGYSHYEVIETPIYEFSLSILKDNDYFSYSIYSSELDITFSFDNKKIISSYEGKFIAIDNNSYSSLYEGMKLYGTLNEDNTLMDLYSFNPRKKNGTVTSFNNIDLTLLEKDANKGIFANNNYMVTFDITSFEKETQSLNIGETYSLYFNKEVSLLDNILDLQYLPIPDSLLLKENKTSEEKIDLMFVYPLKNYDGMPRVDENGNIDDSYIFMNSEFIIASFQLSEPTCFNDLDLENYIGFPGYNITIYNSYKGVYYLNKVNDINYLVKNDEKISEDITIYSGTGSMITYM